MRRRATGRRHESSTAAPNARAASDVPEIAGYSDLSVIGRGATATVYRATQDGFGRTVAIKLLHVDISDRRAQRRFAREKTINGQLSSHPNVVTVFDSGFVDGRSPYLVMEYFGHGSLAKRLADRGPFTLEQALHVGVRIAGALESAHATGVLHRDVKPQNILLSQFGEPALADFGIATVIEMEQSLTAGLTPVHAAPELLEQGEPSPSSDVYALASTIHTLLSGSPPFAGPPGEGVLAQLLRITTMDLPSFARSDVPASLMTALRAATAKRPEERTASAAEFGRALQQIQSEVGLARTALPVELPDEPVRLPVAAPAPADPAAPVLDTAELDTPTVTSGVARSGANPASPVPSAAAAAAPVESPAAEPPPSPTAAAAPPMRPARSPFAPPEDDDPPPAVTPPPAAAAPPVPSPRPATVDSGAASAPAPSVQPASAERFRPVVPPATRTPSPSSTAATPAPWAAGLAPDDSDVTVGTGGDEQTVIGRQRHPALAPRKSRRPRLLVVGVASVVVAAGAAAVALVVGREDGGPEVAATTLAPTTSSALAPVTSLAPEDSASAGAAAAGATLPVTDAATGAEPSGPGTVVDPDRLVPTDLHSWIDADGGVVLEWRSPEVEQGSLFLWVLYPGGERVGPISLQGTSRTYPVAEITDPSAPLCLLFTAPRLGAGDADPVESDVECINGAVRRAADGTVVTEPAPPPTTAAAPPAGSAPA